MYYEVGKKLLMQKYGKADRTTAKEAIKDGFLNAWTPERIRGAFNFGNGTESDFKRYMDNNKEYCIFVNV